MCNRSIALETARSSDGLLVFGADKTGRDPSNNIPYIEVVDVPQFVE